jgi:putative iron-only hydrogenase system regulator
MKKKIGIVSIIVKNREKSAPKINKILSKFAKVIMGRMGIPHIKKNLSVIVLVVNATSDEICSLTSKLQEIPEIEVNCTISKS